MAPKYIWLPAECEQVRGLCLPYGSCLGLWGIPPCYPRYPDHACDDSLITNRTVFSHWKGVTRSAAEGEAEARSAMTDEATARLIFLEACKGSGRARGWIRPREEHTL